MLLEGAVMMASTLLLAGVLARQQKSRLPPLKDGEVLQVEVLARQAVVKLTLYVAGEHFVKSMAAKAQHEREVLRRLWRGERATFAAVWAGLLLWQRRDLLQQLLTELSFSVEMYSDGDLLGVLCPDLQADTLLGLKGKKVKQTRAGADGEKSETGQEAEAEAEVEVDPVERFLLNVLGMEPVGSSSSSSRSGSAGGGGKEGKEGKGGMEGKGGKEKQDGPEVLRSALLVLSAQGGGNMDPGKGAGVPLDLQLTLRVEALLYALQDLCLVMFARQLLMRYKLEPRKSLLSRIISKLGPWIATGLVTFAALYAADQSGLLEVVLVSYKSPFK